MNDKNENSGHYIKSYNNKNDHYDRSDNISSGVKDNVVVSHEAHTYTNKHEKQPSYNTNPNTARSRQQTTPPPTPGTTKNTGSTKRTHPLPPPLPKTKFQTGKGPRNTPSNTNQPTYASDNNQQNKTPVGCVVFIFCMAIYFMLRACS